MKKPSSGAVPAEARHVKRAANTLYETTSIAKHAFNYPIGFPAGQLPGRNVDLSQLGCPAATTHNAAAIPLSQQQWCGVSGRARATNMVTYPSGPTANSQLNAAKMLCGHSHSGVLDKQAPIFHGANDTALLGGCGGSGEHYSACDATSVRRLLPHPDARAHPGAPASLAPHFVPQSVYATAVATLCRVIR